MERSSFRARLFFIAGPAAAIVWSVYAAILTADARQRATECDSGYRQQVRRVEAAKRRFMRARNEALLAMRRASEAGLPVPASAPVAGGAPVNAIAVVGEVPVAPGAEAAAVLAETALVAEAQAAGAPADPAVKGAAVASAAAVAAVATVAEAGVPAPAESVAAPERAVAVARAAANERAQLIMALRERLGGIQVQVDEIRLGSAREDGEEWVRTVRIQLSGKKDLVKKAVASLKTAAPVREMNAGKLEPSAEPGDMRTTVTGTLRASNPGPARG